MKFKLLMFTFLISTNMLAQQNNAISEIIKYGTYAPSSHNAQMWKVRFSAVNTIEVFLDTLRLLPCVDPQKREAWISIGAFVENCVLAASDLGYQSDVNMTPQSVIINFRHMPKEANSFENIRLIKERQTIRSPFLNVLLSDALMDTLCKHSSNVLYYPVNSVQGQKIADCTRKAYRQQMQDEAKLDELAKWMTFSYKEERQRKDGLTPPSLGITGCKHCLYNMFLTKKSVRGKAFVNGSVKSAEKQIEACSGYMLITGKGTDVADWVNSGRLLERTWITCTKYKVAVHPMSQSIEEPQFYSALKAALHIDNEIQMLLRVGKVKKYPEKTGKRRDVTKLIME